MGRKTIPEQDKKEKLYIFVEKKKVDLFGKDECKIIAEESIEKEYKKQLKTKNT